MNFQIGVVAVRFAREHGLKSCLLGTLLQNHDRSFGVLHHRAVVFGLGHLDQAGGICKFILQCPDLAHGAVKLLALAH